MPEFNEPSFENPLTGKVFNSHPEARTSARSACFARGYHVGPDADGVCVDCAGRAGLPFRAEAEVQLPRATVVQQPEVIAHNPNASFDELMAERAMSPEEHREKAAEREKVLAGDPLAAVQISAEQATKIGEAYLSIKMPEISALKESAASKSKQIDDLMEQLKAANDELARLRNTTSAPKAEGSDV